MTFTSLVVSGGGPIFFSMIGAMQELCRQDTAVFDHIESIYCTSAGAFVAILFCLYQHWHLSWESITQYIIQRPWQDILQVNIENIAKIYITKGMYDIALFEKIMKPLFDTVDVSLQITLQEFYEKTKVEMHVYVFELNEFNIVDVSYKTHPELSLLRALHMTCALPGIFSPICMNNHCYIDCGIIYNYPLHECIKNEQLKMKTNTNTNVLLNYDSILGFKRFVEDEKNMTNAITEHSTLTDYIVTFTYKFLFQTIQQMQKEREPTIVIPCEVDFSKIDIPFAQWPDIIYHSELRQKLLEDGTRLVENWKK